MPARSCSKWSGRSAAAGASSSPSAAPSDSCSPASWRSSRSPTRSKRSKFTPGAIFWFRIVTALVFVAAGAWFFARPLSRKVTDEQVALYLEEHEPTLDSTILSAMEVSERPGDWSPELIDRLVENAIERVHEIQEGERIEREPMRRYAWVAGAVAVGAIALFMYGPSYSVTRCRRSSSSRADVEAAAPYRIDVKPGDATVAEGRRSDDQCHALGL